MWRLVKPSESELIELLIAFGREPLTTLGPEQAGVQVSQRRRLGEGEAVFVCAQEAIQRWEMLPCTMDVFWAERRPLVGVTMATGMCCWGLYSLHPCRVTAIIDSRCAERHEFGLTWATVAGHPLCGTETFSLVWDRTSDEVSYSIESVAALPGWLGWAEQRVLQLREKFASDSCQTLQRLVESRGLCTPAAESRVSF